MPPLTAPVDPNDPQMSEDELERFSRLARLTSGLNAPTAPPPAYVRPMPAGQSAAGMARMAAVQPSLGELAPPPRVSRGGFTLTKDVWRPKIGPQDSSSMPQESYPPEGGSAQVQPMAAGRNPAAVSRMASGAGAPKYAGQGGTEPQPPSISDVAGYAQRTGKEQLNLNAPGAKPVYGPNGRSFDTTGVQRLEHQAEYAGDVAANPPEMKDFKHHGFRRALDIIGGVGQGILSLNPIVGVKAYRNLANSDYNNAMKDYGVRLDAAKQAEGSAKDYAEEQQKQTTGEARLAEAENRFNLEQQRNQLLEQATQIRDMVAQGNLANAQSRIDEMKQALQERAREADQRDMNAQERLQQQQWMSTMGMQLKDSQLALAQKKYEEDVTKANQQADQKAKDAAQKAATAQYNATVNGIRDEYKNSFWKRWFGPNEQGEINAVPRPEGAPVVPNNPPGGMVRVQLPGHPPGTIKADQVDAFKKKYPNAQVLQ